MDLDLEQAFQVQGYVRELPGEDLETRGRRRRASQYFEQLETAMANYRGRVTLCPPAAPPKPDRSDDLELVDDDEVDEVR